MALYLTEKLHRILTFLIGLRHPRIFAILSTRGFDQNALSEGWDLFSTAAGAKLSYEGDVDPLSPNEANKLLADLDDWENTWMPVASATLERRYPDLHRDVFTNLSQTSGNEVVLSVSTLLDRLEEMRSKPAGQEADELLVARGLDGDTRAAAREIIGRLRTSGDQALPEVNPDSKIQQEQALEEAWAWYLEWSQIARTVIKRGDVLIRLGLRQHASRGAAEEPEPEPAES